MTSWWEELEIALRAQSEDAPDPWAMLADEGDDEADDTVQSVTGLTADQEAFLRQLAEQPQLGRFDVDDQ